MVKRVLVAFDFDHTLIDETIDTYVLRLLPDGGQLPPSVMKLYSIHEWNDYQREVFRYLHSRHVTKEQLLSCVAEMPVVEGMRELLEYLTKFRLRAGKSESSIREVEKHAVVNGVANAKVVENGVFSSQQQQHSVMNDAATEPLAAENESAVSASAGRPHSVIDGKNPSDFCVQFDVIIVSDANSVSNHHSVFYFLADCIVCSMVSYWHDTVICLSVCLSIHLTISDAVQCG